MLIGATITYKRPVLDTVNQTGIVITDSVLTDYYSYTNTALPNVVNGLISALTGNPVNIQYAACIVRSTTVISGESVVRVVAYKDVISITSTTIQADLPSTTVNVAAPIVTNTIPVPSVTNNVNAIAPVVNVASSPATVNVAAAVTVQPSATNVTVSPSTSTIEVNATAPIVNIPGISDEQQAEDNRMTLISNAMLGKTVRYYQFSNTEGTTEGVIRDKIRVDQSTYFRNYTDRDSRYNKPTGGTSLDAYMIETDSKIFFIPCTNIISVIEDN